MKTAAPLKRTLVKIERQRREGDHEAALHELNRLLETRPDNAQLLVMRAELAQLQEDPHGSPTPDEVHSDLKTAVDLDPLSASALIELGYYLYAIEDNAKESLKYFDKAVFLCADLFVQALIGQAEAHEELGQRPKSLDSLMEACGVVARHRVSISSYVFERIKDLMESLLEADPVSTNGAPKSSS